MDGKRRRRLYIIEDKVALRECTLFRWILLLPFLVRVQLEVGEVPNEPQMNVVQGVVQLTQYAKIRGVQTR